VIPPGGTGRTTWRYRTLYPWRPGPLAVDDEEVGLLPGLPYVVPADAMSPPESWRRYVADGEADDT
jgi:hypothetical protein